ncbi:hypothetical protein RDWZM_001621 [Blomia tropicalis]|uniref:Uncharacterized protein n=1 Tax=Blomia tropicalis TaxID=40697 RepID=A0A9Q0RRG9_BLOTA|nr:hypothetical protein RDWZM_001621 [Blomia tropicalis]
MENCKFQLSSICDSKIAMSQPNIRHNPSKSIFLLDQETLPLLLSFNGKYNLTVGDNCEIKNNGIPLSSSSVQYPDLTDLQASVVCGSSNFRRLFRIISQNVVARNLKILKVLLFNPKYFNDPKMKIKSQNYAKSKICNKRNQSKKKGKKRKNIDDEFDVEPVQVLRSFVQFEFDSMSCIINRLNNGLFNSLQHLTLFQLNELEPEHDFWRSNNNFKSTVDDDKLMIKAFPKLTELYYGVDKNNPLEQISELKDSAIEKLGFLCPYFEEKEEENIHNLFPSRLTHLIYLKYPIYSICYDEDNDIQNELDVLKNLLKRYQDSLQYLHLFTSHETNFVHLLKDLSNMNQLKHLRLANASTLLRYLITNSNGIMLPKLLNVNQLDITNHRGILSEYFDCGEVGENSSLVLKVFPNLEKIINDDYDLQHDPTLPERIDSIPFYYDYVPIHGISDLLKADDIKTSIPIVIANNSIITNMKRLAYVFKKTKSQLRYLVVNYDIDDIDPLELFKQLSKFTNLETLHIKCKTNYFDRLNEIELPSNVLKSYQLKNLRYFQITFTDRFESESPTLIIPNRAIMENISPYIFNLHTIIFDGIKSMPSNPFKLDKDDIDWFVCNMVFLKQLRRIWLLKDGAVGDKRKRLEPHQVDKPIEDFYHGNRYRYQIVDIFDSISQSPEVLSIMDHSYAKPAKNHLLRLCQRTYNCFE